MEEDLEKIAEEHNRKQRELVDTVLLPLKGMSYSKAKRILFSGIEKLADKSIF